MGDRKIRKNRATARRDFWFFSSKKEQHYDCIKQRFTVN